MDVHVWMFYVRVKVSLRKLHSQFIPLFDHVFHICIWNQNELILSFMSYDGVYVSFQIQFDSYPDRHDMIQEQYMFIINDLFRFNMIQCNAIWVNTARGSSKDFFNINIHFQFL